MKKLLTFSLLGALALSVAACSTSDNQTAAPATTTAPPASTPSAPTAGHKADNDIPAVVKAALPNAQTFTKQHKDITPAQKATIEKETGDQVPETDHHSYLAFITEGGPRKQIGAATELLVGHDIQLVVVYESRNGMPYIQEVRTDAAPPVFLDQFKGKGHDDKLILGRTIKAQGVEQTAAKLITSAVAVDVQTMQTLYGAAHTH